MKIRKRETWYEREGANRFHRQFFQQIKVDIQTKLDYPQNSKNLLKWSNEADVSMG